MKEKSKKFLDRQWGSLVWKGSNQLSKPVGDRKRIAQPIRGGCSRSSLTDMNRNTV